MTGRFSSRLERSIARAVGRRRIFPYLAGMTLVLALGSGALVTLTDPKDFPHFGTAVWWAIVTLATVGYGDVVPHTAWGRVLGSVVIVLGVTFLAFLTATVTSFFVSAQQEEGQAKEREHRVQQEQNLAAALTRLEERLTAIEKKLEDRS
jgi:voltage-gated potassium channel